MLMLIKMNVNSTVFLFKFYLGEMGDGYYSFEVFTTGFVQIE